MHKTRGPNKTKFPKEREFVHVNKYGQPDSKEERQLFALLGCLSREPRHLPLDCWDIRLMPQEKLDAIWEEAKKSYYFPEGQEPTQWAMDTIKPHYKGHKSELRTKLFVGFTVEEALANRADYVLEEMWENCVKFFNSDEGRARSKRGSENRAKSKILHYSGTKSFACIRAEANNEIDEIDVWMKAHIPKDPSKMDVDTAVKKKMLEEELAKLPEGCSAILRNAVFKKVVGDDENGYPKTYGKGAAVLRSRKKRSTLAEERANGLKMKMEKLFVRMAEHQGLTVDVGGDDEGNNEDADEGDNEGEASGNSKAYSNEHFDEETDEGDEAEQPCRKKRKKIYIFLFVQQFKDYSIASTGDWTSNCGPTIVRFYGKLSN